MYIFPLIINRFIRLIGNLFKILSHPFHFILPRFRFVIPEHSKAKVKLKSTSGIPRIIWQTNYSNKCALPVYLNYLFNRLMSLDYEYRYVSTEDREIFMRDNAPKDVYEAFLKLNDGAAQADLWRVTVLYLKGGIYMDIDAALVWPLRYILKDEDKAVYLKIKNLTELTNYFLATTPDNQDYKDIMDLIVNNIENHANLKERGVYSTTGPETLTKILNGRPFSFRREKYTCIQGAFTNEYFQYLDKPRGKWTHTKPDDLIKK